MAHFRLHMAQVYGGRTEEIQRTVHHTRTSGSVRRRIWTNHDVNQPLVHFIIRLFPSLI